VNCYHEIVVFDLNPSYDLQPEAHLQQNGTCALKIPPKMTKMIMPAYYIHNIRYNTYIKCAV